MSRDNVQAYLRPPVLELTPECIALRLGCALVCNTTCGLRALKTHHAPNWLLPLPDIHATPYSAHGSCNMPPCGLGQGLSARFADLADHIAFYKHS